MAAREDASYCRGAEVIVRSNRGLETGLVLCEATEDALSHLDQPATGQIVREITDTDVDELAHIDSKWKDKFEICNKRISELGHGNEIG